MYWVLCILLDLYICKTSPSDTAVQDGQSAAGTAPSGDDRPVDSGP